MLIILPGPLTIPPVLLGVYVLSLEFAWAARLRQRTSRAGRQAWSSARAAPWRTAAVTASGFVVLGAGIWAVDRWSLVERVLDRAPGWPG